MTITEASLLEKWIKQWKRAETALAQQKKKELQEMTPEQALAASEALLELGADSRLNPTRRISSGLVEQQALFHKTSSPRTLFFEPRSRSRMSVFKETGAFVFLVPSRYRDGVSPA